MEEERLMPLSGQMVMVTRTRDGVKELKMIGSCTHTSILKGALTYLLTKKMCFKREKGVEDGPEDFDLPPRKVAFEMLVRHRADTKGEGRMGLECRGPPATMKVLGHKRSVKSHSSGSFTTTPGAKGICCGPNAHHR